MRNVGILATHEEELQQLGAYMGFFMLVPWVGNYWGTWIWSCNVGFVGSWFADIWKGGDFKGFHKKRAVRAQCKDYAIVLKSTIESRSPTLGSSAPEPCTM